MKLFEHLQDFPFRTDRPMVTSFRSYDRRTYRW